jgi:hypothetical protein
VLFHCLDFQFQLTQISFQLGYPFRLGLVVSLETAFMMMGMAIAGAAALAIRRFTTAFFTHVSSPGVKVWVTGILYS